MQGTECDLRLRSVFCHCVPKLFSCDISSSHFTSSIILGQIYRRDKTDRRDRKERSGRRHKCGSDKLGTWETREEKQDWKLLVKDVFCKYCVDFHIFSILITHDGQWRLLWQVRRLWGWRGRGFPARGSPATGGYLRTREDYDTMVGPGSSKNWIKSRPHPPSQSVLAF